MKKYLIFILIFITQFAIAQKPVKQKNYNNYYNNRIHVGIKGGMNLVKFDGKGWNSGMKVGLLAGGFVQVKLKKRFSIQGEVLYSQIAADTALNLSEAYNYIRFSESLSGVKLNYIDIPIMINFGIDEINAIKLQAGLQYGFQLNSSQSNLVNNENAFNSGTLSALAGFQWQLGPINIGGRYLVSLGNYNNKTVSSSNLKTQIGQITIGLTF